MRASRWLAGSAAVLLAVLAACTASSPEAPAVRQPADSGSPAPATPAAAQPAATAQPAPAEPATARQAATAEPAATTAATAGTTAATPAGTPAGTPAATPAATTAVAAPPPDLGFPTGPAVMVVAGYEPPTDRVASTGAFLPANGKPTLVFVDAIW